MSDAPTLVAQYIGFISGATPPTPPGGVIYTFMDSTGALKQINDQGAVSAFGGAGGVTSVAGLTGVVTGAGLNAALPVATTALAGTESAADKIAINDFAGSWAEVRWRYVLSVLPQVTRYKYFPSGIDLTAPFDGNVEGGGISGNNATLRKLANTLFQAGKTGKFALSVRAQFGAPTVGVASVVGIINPGGNKYTSFGTAFAGSTTKFVLRIIDGATTYSATTGNADTSLHDWDLISDGTNFTLHMDGAPSGATLATSLLTSDEAQYPFILDSFLGGAVVSDMAWHFIG